MGEVAGHGFAPAADRFKGGCCGSGVHVAGVEAFGSGGNCGGGGGADEEEGGGERGEGEMHLEGEVSG